jgi:pimeloyl-ACP methyl ester carboxylesterase
LSDNAGVRVTVNGVRLYFDVEGCGLAARDREMAARPTIVLLHGGPGADRSLFKPEFSALADAASKATDRRSPAGCRHFAGPSQLVGR